MTSALPSPGSEVRFQAISTATMSSMPLVPFFLSTIYQGERPTLPMIDVPLTKENALPFDLWGLIYKDWKPTPEEGVTVFLQGLENRGDNNLRKRIYFSAMTPDLYGPKYQKKVVAFFDQLFDPKFAGKPFMRHYLDYYFDIYWDLHLGVKGDAIPAGVRQIGESFNTVLAYRNPTQQIVFENYMKVRSLLDPLKEWIDERVKDLEGGRTPDPDKTIAWYWLKNAGNGEHFSRKDIVFEVFHNFVALSQWGNTIFGIMSRLSKHGGDADVRASFIKTMSGDYDHANDSSVHAAPTIRNGTVPNDIPERRQHLGDRRRQAMRFTENRRTLLWTPDSSATAT